MDYPKTVWVDGRNPKYIPPAGTLARDYWDRAAWLLGMPLVAFDGPIGRGLALTRIGCE